MLVMVTRKCRTSLGFDPMSVIVYFEASSSDASIAVKDICAINTFEKLLNILFSEVYC